MTIHRAVLTTKEIAETAHYFGAKKRNRYAIPVAGALQLPEQALPISPYALGVWLGDGHSYGSQITCHNPAAADAASRDGGVNAIHSLGRCRWVPRRQIQSTRRIHFAQRFERQHRSQVTSASSNSQLSLLNFPVSG